MTAQDQVTRRRAGGHRFRRLAVHNVVPTIVCVAGLTALTYLYAGYRYEVWPQPGLLEYVLRLHGQLRADWMTSLPPPHWALAHALALVPHRALDDAVFVLWLAGLVVFWAGVVGIARRLDVPFLSVLALGLIAIPTSLGALGLSQVLNNYMYPTGLAFAFVVAALAFVLGGHAAGAGLALGIAAAIHPNIGVLAAAVMAPALFVGASRARRLFAYLSGFLVIALVPIARLTIDKATSGSLTSAHRYELIAEVRNPHHQLYERFPASEYRQTLLWLAVLAVALWVLRARNEARMIAAVAGATLALATLGGIASVLGSPALLVEAQTARITPLLVLLGMVVGGSALTTSSRYTAALVLFVIFLTARPIATRTGIEVSTVEAAGLLGALAISLRVPVQLRHKGLALAVTGLVALLAIVYVGRLDLRHYARAFPADEVAWRDVAYVARERSQSTDMFLVPPDRPGFRLFAQRPIVVDFGNFPFGEGDAEWVARMETVTGRAGVLRPELGDAPRRLSVIAAAYDRTVTASREPICSYGVDFVVGRAGIAHPSWLERIYRNSGFGLYRVQAETCDSIRT